MAGRRISRLKSPPAQHTKDYPAKLQVTKLEDLYKEIALLLCLETEAQVNITNRPESFFAPRNGP